MTARPSTTIRHGRRAAARELALPLGAVVAASVIAAILTIPEETRGIALDAWLLAVAAIVAWAFLRALAGQSGTAAVSPFDAIEPHGVAIQRPPDDLLAIEWMVMDTERYGQFGFDRLRRLLWETARARLIERRQIDPEVEPDAARRAVGDDIWTLLRPPDPVTPSPAEGAIPRRQLRHVIEVLEEL